MVEIHEESFRIYGAPKITEVLQTKDHRTAQGTVNKYMNKAHRIKPYTMTTGNSDFSIKLKNVLDRDFTPTKPDAAWSSDITYTWKLLDTLHVDGIVSCIKNVKRSSMLSNPVIIHNDRGSQYVSKNYKDNLGVNFIRSYSRKGNPRDNACIESLHALIKGEWLNKYYFKI